MRGRETSRWQKQGKESKGDDVGMKKQVKEKETMQGRLQRRREDRKGEETGEDRRTEELGEEERRG